ncbi:MAG TPA: alpha-hydroxy acid oxidase [Fodinibius sp.]|nr:alpha-hydroxy acid oxidase [Fodinibius sp.]
MDVEYDPQYPRVEDLRRKAQQRIPGFAFDYLSGGCNEEVNLRKNTREIRDIELMPQYIRAHSGADMKTELFGHVYDAPFGIAPVGLQGLFWPGTPEILAKAAFEYNIPFVLSTVSTASIETISEITEGQAWFQLYHPAEDELRDKLLQRAADAGCTTLVILSDVPTFGYRSKEIKNGLSMPPRMTVRNLLQIMSRPAWALRTLFYGRPSFKTMEPYIPEGMDMHHLGLFMDQTFNGRLNEDRIKALRNKWKGNLVIKGLSSEEDMQKAIRLGLDGVIVSNHGGRQHDSGPSAINVLQELAPKYKDNMTIMMDSGLRSGPDIARTMASGAAFTFLGRAFNYGTAALGKKGGRHTISILKRQLQQVMEQIGCGKVDDLPHHLMT